MSTRPEKRKRNDEEGGQGAVGAAALADAKAAASDPTAADPSKPRKRSRWDAGTSATPSTPVAAPAVTAAAVPVPPVSAGLLPTPAAVLAKVELSQGLDKAQQAALIQKQIQERLAALQSKLPPQLAASIAPKNVARPDEKDAALASNALASQRTTDLRGWKPLQLDDLSANGTASVVPKPAQPVKPTGPSIFEKPMVKSLEDANKHLDPRMGPAMKERKPKALNFVKPGKWSKKAAAIRMQQLTREMRASRGAMTADEMELAAPVRSEAIQARDVPQVEWWDLPLLSQETYDSDIKEEKMTIYVHHPVPLAPVGESGAPPPMPLMLTPKERKRLRRQRKLEKQQLLQDQIRLGLMPAPEPKLKLSNMVRAATEQAVAEPSALEAKVRAQIEERRKAHEQANEERHLTATSKRDKMARKVREDLKQGLHVAVFRAGDLSNPQRRFKVDTNASQLALTGCAVLSPDLHVVVVEGGAKSIRKFKRLMLNRIRWDDDSQGGSGGAAGAMDEDADKGDDDGGADSGGGKSRSSDPMKSCVLVWEGQAPNNAFRNFLLQNVSIEAAGRKLFADRHVGHYWDMAKNYRAATDDV